MLSEISSCNERDDLKRIKFNEENEHHLVDCDSLVVRRMDDSANLRFWCRQSARSFCCHCNSVSREKLVTRFRN